MCKSQAALATAVGWVGISGLGSFISRSVWASYTLPHYGGKDEEAGSWLLDSLRAALARRGAERFEALPRTDTERLGSAVRTIELKSSRFKELSTQVRSHIILNARI